MEPFLPPPYFMGPSHRVVPFTSPPTHHPLQAPAGYSHHAGVTAPRYTRYNPNWGPEVHALLHHANQPSMGQSAPTETPTAANESRCQCMWHSDGTLCNQVCANFNDLILHLGHAHDVQGTAARPLACLWLTGGRVCGRKFRRDAFRRHIETHLGHSVSCTTCGKSYSRGDSMRAHARKEHEKQ